MEASPDVGDASAVCGAAPGTEAQCADGLDDEDDGQDAKELQHQSLLLRTAGSERTRSAMNSAAAATTTGSAELFEVLKTYYRVDPREWIAGR